MSNIENLITFEKKELHKGFYNDNDYFNSLKKVQYTDFFDEENDNCTNAYDLLLGLCEHFAISLNQKYKYNVYVIQPIDKEIYHAFCQVYKNKKWFYIDVRGVTSCFEEFIDGVRIFIGDEFTIRCMTENDLNEWKKSYNEAFEFSECIINRFDDYYKL